jgi:hypothetical protein
MAGEGTSTIVRKTETEEPLKEFTITAYRRTSVKDKLEKDLYNVLNKYRSYNYVVTLAALDPIKFIDPNSYRETSQLDNIILKSSGKAVNGESPDFVKLNQNISADMADEIEAFNAESPGKFDFYINNLQIETHPIPNESSGNTLVTRMSFEVFEPYSIVGFLEALRAAGLASGYANYMDATFLLKLEFWGYPDDQELPVAEQVPRSTRFFPIKFIAVEVDVSASGTIYRCEVGPADSFAFTDLDGALKFSLQMTGSTVKEILTDMVQKLNENNLLEEQKSRAEATAKDINQYDIKFLTLEGTDYQEKDNDIADALLKELQVDKTIYQFENIENTTRRTAYQQSGNPKEFVSYEPNKFVVKFHKEAQIHSIISAVIRDSKYWIGQINPDGKVLTDEKGFFNSWRIIPKIEYGEFSNVYRRRPMKITYQVLKDKQHISRLQGYQADIYDSSDINIVREYNYIYTGQNVDILNLKINFDRLFYERMALANGANDLPSGQNAAEAKTGSSDKNEVQIDETTNQRAMVKNLPATPILGQMPVDTNAVGGNAGVPSTDPLSVVARDYYNSLLKLGSLSMITVNMEIIGDPLFLTTGGLGNYIPTLDEANSSITSDGEVDFMAQGIFVKIYFHTPTDVDDDDLSEGGTGLVKFGSPYIKFSGIYMVTKVNSILRDGKFTQTLNLNRMPFVIDSDDYNSIVPNTKKFKTVQNPKDKPIEDVGKYKNVPANKRSALRNLISGVNNLADSIRGVEARIVGSIQGAIEGVTGAVAQIAEVPAQEIAQITNRIESSLQGINSAVSSAADKLGLSPSELSSLSAKEILAAVALSKIIPDNVNVDALEENGVVVPSEEALRNVPPTETKTVESNIKDLNVAEAEKQYAELLEKFNTPPTY